VENLDNSKKNFIKNKNGEISYHLNGEMNLLLFVSPISLQAKSSKKKAFKSKILSLTSKCQDIIFGDVCFDITWFAPESLRYESPSVIDIDNISKVLLDSLSGPDGIIVDDCLIRRLDINWIDTSKEEYVEVRIYDPLMRYLPKNDIQFLNIGKGLCHIDLKSLPDEFRLSIYQRHQEWLLLSEEDRYFSEMAMVLRTATRLIHKNKISGFDIITIETTK